MTQRYDVHVIEKRWRQRWQATEIYQTDLDHAARPFYNLMEFPYPSGEGLHVGHVYTYCGADVYGRLLRMQGHDVFQPMGFDAFGIHSENYAIKLGVNPAELVPANIRRFREEQLQRLGCQFDWSREVDTTSPDYYRWTQWIFVQLFKTGLAYRAESPVNWCPRDQTVLANEQVIDGRCERCDSPIEQRVMHQWFFRITEYADRLLDFSAVDFPQSSIKRQTAWIGRSEGAEIRFSILGSPLRGTRFSIDSQHPGGDRPASEIAVFTTRPDTICGATFIALAPEHPAVMSICAVENREAVTRYVEQSARRLERERLIDEAKTGVPTGAYALNPATGESIPIWVADYVLPRYGTGAIMGVPAHDSRDHDFAVSHRLPIKPVIIPPYDSPGSDSIQNPKSKIQNPYEGEGILIDSGPWSGMSSEAARPAITRWLEAQGVGRARTTYRLRDWLISRQRYWGPPIPIIYCDLCGTLPVPEDQLPVLLPPVQDSRPRGVSPLAGIPEFVNTSCPQCGGPARRETDVSDNFLDSAWYYLRYTSTEYGDRPWDAERVRRWLPVDHYAGGPEHTTLHHLYARFIAHALHDLGHLPFREPFRRLRLHGTITRDGAKMSKSRGNVISPDSYIAEYGADVFRMYMLFLGPWQEGGDWSDSGLTGVARFVSRVWNVIEDARESFATTHDAANVTHESSAMTHDAAAERRRHHLIARVTDGIETLRFHVAIAALMEDLNWLRESWSGIGGEQRARSIRTFVLLLAPFAPHLAEEWWERIGGSYSVHQEPWPEHDSQQLESAVIELPVQINGKLRDRITVAADADDATVTHAALSSERVLAALGGESPRRVIVVPGKVVNIVR